MKTSVDVCNFLQSQDVKHELVTLDGQVKDAVSMADILGLKPREIVKTLLFMVDGIAVMVLVPGDRKVDGGKLKSHLHAETVSFATEPDIRKVSEYHVAALPPVGLSAPVKTVVDKRVKAHDTVYAAGGSPNVVLKMRTVDLIKVTAAAIADIAE